MNMIEVLKSAKELYRQAKFNDEIALLESTIKSDNWKTLDDLARVYVELSRVKRTAGLYEECRQCVEKALLLTSSPQVMVEIWNEQGQLFDSLGKHSEAADLLQNAVAVARSSLTASNPLTAEVLTTLSLAHLRLGEMKNCTMSAQEAETILRESVGESDERYACAIEHLGLALLYSGKINEPEALHRKALEIRTAYFGADHPEIAFSLLNLAGTLQASGKAEGIEEMMKRAVDIFRKYYGDDNSTTATAINNLGGFYLEHGNFKDAATQFELALSLKERMFGTEDAVALRNVVRNLGIAYDRLGRKAEARQCLDRTNVMLTKLATAKTDIELMTQSASDLLSQRKWDEAVQLLTSALAIAETEHGPDSPKTALILKYLGTACTERDSEQAKTYLIRSLRITKHEFGKTHPRTGQVLDELASCFLLQGDRVTHRLLQQQSAHIAASANLPTAEETLIASLMASADKTGGNPQVLAAMLLNAGREQEADALTEKFIESLEAQGGGKLAKELITLGLMESGRLRNEKAVEYLQRALKIYRDMPDVKGTITALQTLCLPLCDLARYDEARTVCQQWIELQERNDGSNHWSLKNALSRLQLIEEKAGNQEAAQTVKRRIAALDEPNPIEQQERHQAQIDEIMSNVWAPFTEMLHNFANLSPQTEEQEDPGAISATDN